METTLIRGFVLFLALTGFGASSFSNASHSGSASAKVTIGSGGSVPMCAPNSGQTCGLD